MKTLLIIAYAGMRKLVLISALLSTIICPAQDADQVLKISHLTGNFYIYTTWGDAGNGYMFPANGMYLETTEGVVLFDTPWDTTQFGPLEDSIRARSGKEIVMCIATHFHEDRTAGLNYYSRNGAKTYTSARTDALSKEKGEPRAQNVIYKDTIFVKGQYCFETYYPGKGHSPDNIVIWFAKEKLLYGGCFVKSAEAQGPGNLSDTDIDEWILSIKRVQKRFRAPAFVIPGHQDWNNKRALDHTLKVLEKYRKQTGSKQ